MPRTRRSSTSGTGHHGRPPARPCRVGLALVLAAGVAQAAASQLCTSYLASLPKGQALYLFLPASDSTVTVGGTSYSVGDFDAADLDASLSTSALRDKIHQLVRDAYCEFSVDVKQTTSVPSPGETRWQIVGIGTDVGTGAFGKSYVVDMGDSEGTDFARVWADQFDVDYGYSGGPMDGALSTLDRWATIIGGTVSHEGGHNYGLNHTDAPPRSGTSEDATLNHILATGNDFGSTKYERGDNRAKRDRHFSDTSFEILGHNLGFNTKTLHNWDFVNPNDVDATALRITVLSTAAALAKTGAYNGSLSPWTNPTVTKRTGTGSTQSFQGTTYDIYDVDFTTAKAWSNGAAGTVPPAAKFHVGVSLSDSHVVWEVKLSNASGDLPLQPRMFGYDAGTVGTDTDGDFELAFFNTDDDLGELILQDLQILFVPRAVDIEQMIGGGEMLSVGGLAVEAFQRRMGSHEAAEREREQRTDRQPIRGFVKRLEVGGQPATVAVARLADERHVDLSYDSTGCTPGIQKPGGFEPFDEDIDLVEVIYCPDGEALSLFPASYTYVTATVVDPDARYWDPATSSFVDGPLASRLFYQFSGIVPDLNDNGRDDLLDIRDGLSRDANKNGIPDEAEKGRWALTLRGGVTEPHTSLLDPAASLNLGVERYLTPSWTVEGLLGYHEFDLSPGSGEVLQLSLNARYFGSRAGIATWFVNLGSGAYDFDNGPTKLGFNSGVGLDFELQPDLSLEAAYNYHHVDGGSVEFSTWQIGLRWEL